MGPAGRGRRPSQLQSGCEFHSSKKEQFCLMGCPCQCLPWQLSWYWNPGMLWGKCFSVSQPKGPAPSSSTWKNMPLRAATLMLLLKAATDTPSDSITHACTHTPSLIPQITMHKAEEGECSSLQLPFSQRGSQNVNRCLQGFGGGGRGEQRLSGQMC